MRSDSSRRASWLRSQAKRLLVWLVVALLVLASVLVWYGGTPHEAEPARLDAVRENPDVVVEELAHGYVLRDAGADDAAGRTGLVFYPGGRVDAAAYLWTLAPLVERTDVRVFVPEMPLHVAVFDPGRAAGLVGDRPAVDRWYVGGHSLGGAMACRFGVDNSGQVRGVVLLGSYCPAGSPLPDRLDVLAVTGSRDGVLDRESFRSFRERAPADARFVELAGVNHSQFGAYGGQPGDRPATVNDETARERLTAALVEWFADRGRRATDVGRTPLGRPPTPSLAHVPAQPSTEMPRRSAAVR